MDSRHRRGLWLGLDELEAGQSSRAAGEGRGAGKGGVAGKVQMGASGGQVGAAGGQVTEVQAQIRALGVQVTAVWGQLPAGWEAGLYLPHIPVLFRLHLAQGT